MHHLSPRWKSILCFIFSFALVLSAQFKSPAQNNLADPLYQAAAQEFQLGQQNYDQENYTQSLRHLQEAQRLFGSGQYPIQLALVQANLASVYHELGQTDVALQVIEASLATSGISERIQAQALDVKAKLHYFKGEYNEALKNWQQAQALYQKVADPVGKVTNKINQAYAYLSLGQHADYYDLLEDLEKKITSSSFTTQFNSPAHQQLVIQQVARFLRTAGKYEEAIAFLKPQTTQHPDQLDYQLELAQLLQYQGDRAGDGDAYFQTTSSPWHCSQVTTEQSRKDSDYGKAIAIYQHIIDSRPSPKTQVKAQIQLLQLLYKTHHESEAATLAPQIVLSGLVESRELVSREIELAQAMNCVDERQVLGLLTQAYNHAEALQDPYSSSDAMGNLGGYYAQKVGDFTQAKEYTQAAWAIAQKISAPYLGYQWLWQLGQIEKQEQKTADALAHYANAAQKLATVRHNFVHLSQDIRFSFQQNIRPFYREYLALLLDEGDTEHLKLAEAVVTDLQLAEVEDFLRCQSNASRALYEVEHRDATIIYPILLVDRLDLIVELPTGQAVKQLEGKKINDRNNSQILHFSDINQTQDLAEFIKTLDNLKAWIKKKDWNSDEILMWSQDIYQYLIAPIEADIPEDGTLVFVVDGYLQGLPFAALHDGEHYLIEKHGVAVSIGSQFTASSSSNIKDSLIVLAGISDAPDYWQSKKLSKLPNVSTELQKIAALAPSKVLQNADLKLDSFKLTLEKDTPSTIHLATHGEFNADPDLMQLFLWDEPLTVNQFARMLRVGADRNPEPINLLVLSACETATGDQRATLGMAGTAIRANATSTVASLWKVSDRSTAELMEAFYTGLLKENLSKVEALRQAQVKLLQEQIEFDGKVNPYNWAAFVLAGDWH